MDGPRVVGLHTETLMAIHSVFMIPVHLIFGINIWYMSFSSNSFFKTAVASRHLSILTAGVSAYNLILLLVLLHKP
jgi:hypothetical protein